MILCGSSMSFMEYQVLGYESPLYGRRTGQFKIQALSYKEVKEFSPTFTVEQQAIVYGITSGIPHYINKLAVENDVDEALKDNLFNTSSYIFEEPENLLKQELREPAIYNSVITAVASGASRSNEIATKVGIDIVGTLAEGCYIFSKSGFTKGLKELEERNEVRLVDLADMYM